jgi:SNF2 family DNA or RNA helicase
MSYCEKWEETKPNNPLSKKNLLTHGKTYIEIDKFCKNEIENCKKIKVNPSLNPLTNNNIKKDLFRKICDFGGIETRLGTRLGVVRPLAVIPRNLRDFVSSHQGSSQGSSRGVGDGRTRVRLTVDIPYEKPSPILTEMEELTDLILKSRTPIILESPINEFVLPLESVNFPNIKLKDYQKKAVKHIIDNNIKRFLLFHSVGSGKTITSITIIKELKEKQDRKVIVVSPKSLQKNFKKEMIKLGLNIYTTQMTFDGLHKEVKENGINKFKDCILVIDEAHNIRTKIGPKVGLKALSVLRASSVSYFVLLLSATPIVNSPDDFANLYLILSQQEKSVLYKEWMKMTRKTLKDDADLVISSISKNISYFKNTDLTYYPSVKSNEIILEMNNEYFEEYKKIEDNTFESDIFKESDLKPFYNGVRRGVNSLDSKQISSKTKWIFDRLVEEPHLKTVIYSNWVLSGVVLIKQLLKDVGISSITISGDTTLETRENNVNKFNAGIKKILFITSAGGEGLDLKGTRRVFIMEPHWNNEKIKQVVGRSVRLHSHSHLPTNERKVDIFYMILKKPGVNLQKSADVILREMSLKKSDNNLDFYLKLIRYSI